MIRDFLDIDTLSRGNGCLSHVAAIPDSRVPGFHAHIETGRLRGFLLVVCVLSPEMRTGSR